VARLFCTVAVMVLVMNHQLAGICCQSRPTTAEVAVGLHSSVGLATVVAVANGDALSSWLLLQRVLHLLLLAKDIDCLLQFFQSREPPGCHAG
jgi:hypothetical protein